MSSCVDAVLLALRGPTPNPNGSIGVWPVRTVSHHITGKHDAVRFKRSSLASMVIPTKMFDSRVTSYYGGVVTRHNIKDFSVERSTDMTIFIHLSLNKMAAISQTKFFKWNAFSWMKRSLFRLKFHWNLFPLGLPDYQSLPVITWANVNPDLCRHMASLRRSTARPVQDGFFPYWAQMITGMRGCVAHNTLWPWPISFRSFRYDFAIKPLKYCTACMSAIQHAQFWMDAFLIWHKWLTCALRSWPAHCAGLLRCNFLTCWHPSHITISFLL